VKGPGSESPILHFFFRKIFNTTIDRWLAFAAVVISFAVIAARAFGSVNALPDFIDHVAMWQWFVILAMIISVMLITLWIFVGRKCVVKVAAIVSQNMTHLAKNYLKNNQSAADALHDFVATLENGNHGI
jgi:hypothetical protein